MLVPFQMYETSSSARSLVLDKILHFNLVIDTFSFNLFILILFYWNSRFIHLVQHFALRIPILQGI